MGVSNILMKVLKNDEGKHSISYGDLVAKLGEQAFGLIMILFALPSVLPLSVIPGFSFLFTLPILIVAIYLILGKETLWLPEYLAKKEINKKRLQQIIKKTAPYLIKMEQVMKPRWLFLTSKGINRLHGLLLIILGFLLTLPIPLSNFFLAFLVILMGLGLAQRDGVMIVVTYLGTILLFLLFTQVTQALLGFF